MRRTGIAGLMVLSLLSACTSEGAWDMISSSVSSPDWSSSARVTIDTSAVDGFLFDVPIPLRLTADRIASAAAGVPEEEVAVYDAPYEEGTVALDHEVAAWDPDDASVVWVRLPFVSAAEPIVLYVYAGTETAAVAEDPEGVWRNGYVSVLHFDDPDDPWGDSSRFGNHGAITNGKSAPLLTDGIAGRGFTNDDPTDAVSVPNSATTDTMAPFTWEAWLRVPAGIDTRRVFSKGARYLTIRDSGDDHRYQARLPHVSDPPAGLLDDVFGEWNEPARVDSWYHLALTWNGLPSSGSIGLWVNGESINRFQSGPTSGNEGGEPNADSGFPLSIANDAGFGADGALTGIVDEVFVSGAVRSSSWLRFQVDAMNEATVMWEPFEPN